MQFSKIAAILSFAAAAVAAPAPIAAPEAALESRTSPPNACKKGGKYYKYSSDCPSPDAYYCKTTAVIAVLNCVNIDLGFIVLVDLIDVIGLIL